MSEELKTPTVDEMREQRIQALTASANYITRMLINLGPVFAATVTFTAPGKDTEEGDQMNVETVTVSTWLSEDVGAEHLAQSSDKLNQQHVELQAELDRRQHGEGEVRTPEGGVPHDGADPGRGPEARAEGQDADGRDQQPE